MRHLALALGFAWSLCASSTVGAEEAWELDVFGGYGQLAFPPTDTAAQNWANGGPAFALTGAFRGPHFTHPFLDLAYVPIAWSSRNVYIPDGGAGRAATANNAAWALSVIIGPGWDIDWFRFRVGVGLYDVNIRTSVLDQTNTSSKLTLGFLATAGALVWRPQPFAVGVDLRLAAFQSPLSGIYQSSWAAGVTGRWDFAH